MRDSLAHRGPDDAGMWTSVDGAVVLGSRRLAILDLSPGGHQPMPDTTGTVRVVFNGEIYNYVELREELAQEGYGFRSRTDTEVLLAAYKAWGTDCLARLNGMFAFAIWDEKRKRLFAARDRFGEKPFYYHCRPERGVFLFGSEIKALLMSKLVDARPNNSAVYQFLVLRELDRGAETMFLDILALPPAHALVYSPGPSTLKVWRYWNLDPDAEIRLANDDAYGERLLDLLRDSVRLRLRSDVPVGSSLSGGLDSSTIVSLVAQHRNGQRQETFSARFHDAHFDEGPHIQRMADWAGVQPHYVYPDPARLPDELEVLTWYQGQPFFGSSVYAQWSVMRLAKECRVTVLLDGQGGDELLAGYHYYFGAYYRALIQQFRWGTFLSSFYCFARDQGPSSLPIIFYYLLPPSLRPVLRRLVRPSCIPAEFAHQWGSRSVTPAIRFKDPVKEVLYETLTTSVLPTLLRYADRNSMAFSREVRLPLLDHRLVEFLFAIPAEQKMRGAETKVVLRNAIRGIVPEETRTRKDKLGFAPPQASWLRGPQRLWAEEVLRSSSFRHRPWTEPKVVERIWQRFLSGQSHGDTMVWRWLSLEFWARVFLDQSPERFAAGMLPTRRSEQVLTPHGGVS
jgi:asparagine synthase (glutamine-hydrolysing)